MPGDLQKTKIVFELDFVPTEGTRLPISATSVGSAALRQAGCLAVYGH